MLKYITSSFWTIVQEWVEIGILHVKLSSRPLWNHISQKLKLFCWKILCLRSLALCVCLDWLIFFFLQQMRIQPFFLLILQVSLTKFSSLPPLFQNTPNAVHELTLASNVLLLQLFEYTMFYLIILLLNFLSIYFIFDMSIFCYWGLLGLCSVAFCRETLKIH